MGKRLGQQRGEPMRPTSPNGSLVEQAWYKAAVEAVDNFLDVRLPPGNQGPTVLHEAMRYAVFGRGKRLRPVLVLSACRALGGEQSQALPAAAAVELIHTYSLVHDDLPAMDDDDMRRGRPTLHKVYDDATAILVGDALLTLAFELLADDLGRQCGPDIAVQASLELARAAGSQGLIAGQMKDLAAEGQNVDAESLERIHRAKTGALFVACVRLGGLTAGADHRQLAALTTYAQAFGLAFQIVDDILDVVGEAHRLGRPSGRDEDRGKATFPRLYGLAGARRQVEKQVVQARQALADLNLPARQLELLLHFVAVRDH